LAILAEYGRCGCGKFLRLFTDVPLDEVVRLENRPDSEINDAKIVLATEATAMLHGSEAATAAAQTARTTFAEGGTGENLPRLSVGGRRASAPSLGRARAGSGRSPGTARAGHAQGNHRRSCNAGCAAVNVGHACPRNIAIADRVAQAVLAVDRHCGRTAGIALARARHFGAAGEIGAEIAAANCAASGVVATIVAAAVAAKSSIVRMIFSHSLTGN